MWALAWNRGARSCRHRQTTTGTLRLLDANESNRGSVMRSHRRQLHAGGGVEPRRARRHRHAQRRWHGALVRSDNLAADRRRAMSPAMGNTRTWRGTPAGTISPAATTTRRCGCSTWRPAARSRAIVIGDAATNTVEAVAWDRAGTMHRQRQQRWHVGLFDAATRSPIGEPIVCQRRPRAVGSHELGGLDHRHHERRR